MGATKTTYVLPALSKEDRIERLLQRAHRIGPKPVQQTRSNERRRAIRDSREG